MTPEKVLEVIANYRQLLQKMNVPMTRIEPTRTGPFTSAEMCSHAHFLLGHIGDWIHDPEKQGKMNRHLASVQMMLWCAGIYSLADLMDHNRPKEGEVFDPKS